MKKAIPVIIAIILIIIIVAAGFGKNIVEKYSYGTETADMEEYFEMAGQDSDARAIVLQNDRIADKAHVWNGEVYFSMQTVLENITDELYLDEAENKLLHTDALDTMVVEPEQTAYSDSTGNHDLGYVIYTQKGETSYIAADYLKRFANFSYQLYDHHLVLRTKWGISKVAEIQKDTQVRIQGGIKSPILREVATGDLVEVLEQMENWSKVVTTDGITGYVENKLLGEQLEKKETPVKDYVPAEYTSLQLDEKLCLGWHSIGGKAGNDTLGAMVTEGKGMNVIAPTWFSLADNEGHFRSFADADYVAKAHKFGLKVFGVWDNFNYRNETGAEISTYETLRFTSKRQAIVQNMIDTTLSLGMDGINIDFEGLTKDTGVHFVQFIRELSVACRKNKLFLSIDNYMPNQGNTFYRVDVQGKVADYVILMGYDEHWHGSGDPGSVASIGFVRDGIEKTLKSVPEQKVVNALPFYTILWKTEGTQVTDSYITLNNTPEFLKKNPNTPVWDEATSQNYMEWESDGATYRIWIEDTDSIKAKLNVMSAYKLGGIAVWRLGYGTQAVWELVSLFKQM